MLFIAPDVVVLDPWATVAAEYRRFQPPRAAFSLPAPYQGAKASDGSGASGSLGGRAAPAAMPAAEAAEAAEAEQQGGAKRRRRRSSYQPNEREQQAAARHAEYAPALAAAAASVQDWLQRSGACTVHEAIAGTQQAGDPEACRQQRRRHHSAEQRPADSGHAGSGAGSCCAQEAPDYLALYEQRHAVRPKLQCVPEPAPMTPAGGAAAAAAAAAGAADPGAQGCPSPGQAMQQGQPPQSEDDAARRQGAQQDFGPTQPCNLFDRLISTGGRVGEQLAWAAGHAMLLPPRCRFLMSDARRLAPLLEEAAEAGGYHCIVLDPPWENRSAKRSGRYPTLPSRNLLGLPVPALMHPDGCLVAMWVTNRERHRRFIDAELLPAWGLRCLATWHWLKISDGGEPAGRLDIEHRRPYESLLLCWPAHHPLPGPLGSDSIAAPPVPGAAAQQAAAAAAAASQAAPASGLRQEAAERAAGFHLLPGRQLVIAAVPPAEHSRKPHLGELLLPLLPPGARCLEMFARELHSGWTSWGNEVLKMQSANRFVQLQGGAAGL